MPPLWSPRWVAKSGGNFGSAGAPALSSPYFGPGDVAPGALAWWGMRAYSQAAGLSQTPAIRLLRTSDNAQSDFNVLPTGLLDTGSIAAFLGASTGNVVKLYDQTGHGWTMNCPGSGAGFPVYNLGGGVIPNISFTNGGGVNLLMSGSTFSNNFDAVSFPSGFLMSQYCVAKPSTNAPAAPQGLCGIRNADTNSANYLVILQGGDIECRVRDQNGNATTLNTTPYSAAWQVFASSAAGNGGSIILYLNGSNAQSAGIGANPTNMLDGFVYEVGCDGSSNNSGAQIFNGLIGEAGVWNSILSPAAMSNLYANVNLAGR